MLSFFVDLRPVIDGPDQVTRMSQVRDFQRASVGGVLHASRVGGMWPVKPLTIVSICPSFTMGMVWCIIASGTKESILPVSGIGLVTERHMMRWQNTVTWIEIMSVTTNSLNGSDFSAVDTLSVLATTGGSRKLLHKALIFSQWGFWIRFTSPVGL